MNARNFHLLMGIFFLILSGISSYNHNTFYAVVGIILANMWIISASFKE